MSPDDRALGFEEVSRELATIGLNGRDGAPYTVGQIELMCKRRKLPFFKAPDRRRLIMRSVLLATVESWQNAARRELKEAKESAERVRRQKKRS